MRTNVSGGGFSREYGDALGAGAPAAVAAERQRVGQPGAVDARNRRHPAQRLVVVRVALAHASSTCAPGSIRSAAARSGWNPRLTSSTRRKLRISRPAPTSSTHASAISDTTSASRIQARRLPAARSPGAFFQRRRGRQARARAAPGRCRTRDRSALPSATVNRERTSVDMHAVEQRNAERVRCAMPSACRPTASARPSERARDDSTTLSVSDLPDQASASGAKRDANGQLLLPCRSSAPASGSPGWRTR